MSSIQRTSRITGKGYKSGGPLPKEEMLKRMEKVQLHPDDLIPPTMSSIAEIEDYLKYHRGEALNTKAKLPLYTALSPSVKWIRYEEIWRIKLDPILTPIEDLSSVKNFNFKFVHLEKRELNPKLFLGHNFIYHHRGITPTLYKKYCNDYRFDNYCEWFDNTVLTEKKRRYPWLYKYRGYLFNMKHFTAEGNKISEAGYAEVNQPSEAGYAEH